MASPSLSAYSSLEVTDVKLVVIQEVPLGYGEMRLTLCV